MKLPLVVAALAATLALALPLGSFGASDADDGARAEVRSVTGSLLQRFYTARPRLMPEVRAAAGYALFSTYGGNLIGERGAGGKGVGVAFNLRDGRETFMGMAQASPDGKGMIDRELLIVFPSQKAFDEFALRGWKEGAAASDAKVYAISGNTVEVSPSIAGARFWNDHALN